MSHYSFLLFMIYISPDMVLTFKYTVACCFILKFLSSCVQLHIFQLCSSLSSLIICPAPVVFFLLCLINFSFLIIKSVFSLCRCKITVLPCVCLCQLLLLASLFCVHCLWFWILPLSIIDFVYLGEIVTWFWLWPSCLSHKPSHLHVINITYPVVSQSVYMHTNKPIMIRLLE